MNDAILEVIEQAYERARSYDPQIHGPSAREHAFRVWSDMTRECLVIENNSTALEEWDNMNREQRIEFAQEREFPFSEFHRRLVNGDIVRLLLNG